MSLGDCAVWAATSYYPSYMPTVIADDAIDAHNSLSDLHTCVPYLREVVISQPKDFYRPPTQRELRSAGAMAVESVMDTYVLVPKITVCAEMQPGARNFCFIADRGEEDRIDRLYCPDPLDLDDFAAAVQQRQPNAEDAVWDEEFWRLVTHAHAIQQRELKEARLLRRERKRLRRGDQSRASRCSVGGNGTPATPFSCHHSLTSLATSGDFGAESTSKRVRAGGGVAWTPDAVTAVSANGTKQPMSSAQRNAKGFLRRARYNESRLGTPGAQVQPSPVQRVAAKLALHVDGGFRLPVPSVTSDASNWPDLHSAYDCSNMPSVLADLTTPMTSLTGGMPPTPQNSCDDGGGRHHGREYVSITYTSTAPVVTASTAAAIPLGKPRAAPKPIAPARTPAQTSPATATSAKVVRALTASRRPSLTLQPTKSSSLVVIAREPVRESSRRSGLLPPSFEPTRAAAAQPPADRHRSVGPPDKRPMVPLRVPAKRAAPPSGTPPLPSQRLPASGPLRPPPPPVVTVPHKHTRCSPSKAVVSPSSLSAEDCRMSGAVRCGSANGRHSADGSPLSADQMAESALPASQPSALGPSTPVVTPPDGPTAPCSPQGMEPTDLSGQRRPLRGETAHSPLVRPHPNPTAKTKEGKCCEMI